MIQQNDIIEIFANGKRIFSDTFKGLPPQAQAWAMPLAKKDNNFSGLPLLGNVDVYIIHCREVPLCLK